MNSQNVRIPADIIEIHPNLFALEVDMDAMHPSVPEGSFVAVDPNTLPPTDGAEMGVVEVDGAMYLCRPMRLMGQVVMQFDHPDVRPVTFPISRARVVGAVVWVLSPVMEGVLARG